MFFFWDVYDDISHPGGVPMRYFSVSWQVRGSRAVLYRSGVENNLGVCVLSRAEIPLSPLIGLQ